MLLFSMDNLLSNLQETAARQNQILNDLCHKITAMDMKYDQISQTLGHDTGEHSDNHSSIRREESHHTTSNNYIQTRTIHLDFPHCDGSDPAGWIYKVEQFFSYHQTPIEQRLMISSSHLEGNALQWLRWMDKAGAVTEWQEFTRALEI
ncbi:hypothetical protein AMTRI_Chr13g86450 [Amborella trichopoda]